MWDFPRSGMELMSPALAGGCFTAESPGKTLLLCFRLFPCESLWCMYHKTLRLHYLFFVSNFIYLGASLVSQMVKNLPAMQETWVRSLGREDLLEKGMATHSRILAWRILGQRNLVGSSPVHRVTKSWTLSDWSVTNIELTGCTMFIYPFTYWRTSWLRPCFDDNE